MSMSISIERLQGDNSNLFVLSAPSERSQVLPAANKLPQAVVALLLMVGLMVSGVVPNVQAALLACLLMGALGCVDFASAYRSIHWKSIVLIVGMLPFSLALQRTGGVDLAADALMALAGGAGAHVILGSLFLITATLGLFISNTATAVLIPDQSRGVVSAELLVIAVFTFAIVATLQRGASGQTVGKEAVGRRGSRSSFAARSVSAHQSCWRWPASTRFGGSWRGRLAASRD